MPDSLELELGRLMEEELGGLHEAGDQLEPASLNFTQRQIPVDASRD